MDRRKRVSWEHGDLFAVPLADGSFGIVQAIDHWMPHWVYTAVTDCRAVSPPTDLRSVEAARVISLLAISDREFDFGAFPRVGHASLLARRKDFGNERFAKKGYIGASSYTGGILAAFLSAWHGAAPWNAYKDPAYFDQLLAAGVTRPSQVVISDGS